MASTVDILVFCEVLIPIKYVKLSLNCPSVYDFNCVLANPILVLVCVKAPNRYTVLASTVVILVFCVFSIPSIYSTFAVNAVKSAPAASYAAFALSYADCDVDSTTDNLVFCELSTPET